MTLIGNERYNNVSIIQENSNIYYLCRDYLESITSIRDNSGTYVAEYGYDAWGRLRNPYNQEIFDIDDTPALLLGRGFTGHEYLPWFGLRNMNARLYDPVLGRFLCSDLYVQSPDFMQGFNFVFVFRL